MMWCARPPLSFTLLCMRPFRQTRSKISSRKRLLPRNCFHPLHRFDRVSVIRISWRTVPSFCLKPDYRRRLVPSQGDKKWNSLLCTTSSSSFLKIGRRALGWRSQTIVRVFLFVDGRGERFFHMVVKVAVWKLTVESGKNVTYFEQLFCFYQLVLVVWNTFGAKFKLLFISWVKQNWHFLWQWRKKLPFPHLGELLGETGVREESFSPVVGSAEACTTCLFLLDHRTTCTVFPVFAMFAMTTMVDSCTLTPVSQVTSIKACWAHFSLPFERLLFQTSTWASNKTWWSIPRNFNMLNTMAGFFFHHFERKDV